MIQESPAKVKVKAINQVCLVVKDALKSAENYWNILGIGPWNVHIFEPPTHYDYEYRGGPAQVRLKVSIAQVGVVQLELVEHIDGVSIYKDFLDEHGEGLHHLSFIVDDVDKTTEILNKQGFPSIQSGRIGDKGAYNCVHIEPLHAIWVLVHMPNDMGAESAHYPATPQESPAKVEVKSIDQVALVVRDIPKTVEVYWNVLGIGPWDIYDWEAPFVYDYTYYGKLARAKWKVALTMVGPIMLELIEHVEGATIYQDFLKKHGEGLHHLNFMVDDVDKTVEILNKQGFQPRKVAILFVDTNENEDNNYSCDRFRALLDGGTRPCYHTFTRRGKGAIHK